MTALAGRPTVPTASAPTASALAARVLLAGLAGGAVDFVYATALALLLGRSVEKLWQTVASGLIGRAAHQGGWAAAALGIVTHFAIAGAMALAYALAAGRLPALARRPVACGVLYGFVLYAVMYGLVLPVRFGRAYHWNGLFSVADILAHVAVGLVIALVIARPHKLTRPA